MKYPDINVLFDYLTVTFPIDESEQKFIDKFGDSYKSMFRNDFFKHFTSLIDIDITKFTDKGSVPHYEKMLIFEEFITFKYNGPLNANDIPTHSLELKGEGCREVELLGIDWFELLKYIFEKDLNISTWHLACDIFTPKYFTIDQILKKTKNDEFTSIVKSCYWIEGKKNGSYTGTSIYHGRRDGNQINIYDKQYERYYRGYEVDTNFWIRIEIRLKSKTWDLLQWLVGTDMDSLPEIYFSVLRDMLEYKVKGTTINKSRWKIWRPWERLLHENPRIKLYNQAQIESDITRIAEYDIKHSGKAKLLLRASMTDEEYEEHHKKMVNEKKEKLDNKDLSKVNKKRMSNGMSIFNSLEELQEFFVRNGLV